MTAELIFLYFLMELTKQRNHYLIPNQISTKVLKKYALLEIDTSSRIYQHSMHLCYVHALCIHPVSNRSRNQQQQLSWFHDGPPLTVFPVPIPDPNRPWGGKCDSVCTGHATFFPLKMYKTYCKQKNKGLYVQATLCKHQRGIQQTPEGES